MKRKDSFPHLDKTFVMPDTDGCDSIQYYYNRMLACITPEASKEQVLDFMCQVDGFVQAAKRLQADMKQSVIEYIQEHGDIVMNDTTRYYTGPAKTTTCPDQAAAIDELLHVFGGDIRMLSGMIKANGIKHGAAKSVLSQAQYDRLFVIEAKTVLREGKPTAIQLLKKTSPFPTLKRKTS